jgi:hypothetical protein
MAPMRRSTALALALSLGTHLARAEETPAPPVAPAAYSFSMRALGGPGGGGHGWGGRLGLSGEWWLSDIVGVGAFGAVSSQMWGDGWLGPSNTETMLSAGPAISVRSGGSGSYGLLNFGLGYAAGERTHHPGFQFPLWSTPTPSTVTHSRGIAAALLVGWMFHPGGVEIGPALDLDMASQGEAFLTLNFALGFAAR